MLQTSLYWISVVCVTERLSTTQKLFPPKSTENFHTCGIRVASYGIPPYIILTGNSTDSDGNVVYTLGGLAVHNLRLAVDKMNVTVVFLKPAMRFTVVEATKI